MALELSRRLAAGGIPGTLVSLDAWLVSVEERKPGSMVLERYECDRIVEAIRRILEGEEVRPPAYDPVTRRRTAQAGGPPIRVKSGVLLVEGVVALAIASLKALSVLSVHIAVPDTLRLARLRAFYREVKGVPEQETETIIAARELEEVALIQRAGAAADAILELV